MTILGQDEHWYRPKVSLLQTSPGELVTHNSNSVKVKNQEAGLLTEAELRRLERVLEVDF